MPASYSLYRSKHFGHDVRIKGHGQVCWRLRKQIADKDLRLDFYIWNQAKQLFVDQWIEDQKLEIRNAL